MSAIRIVVKLSEANPELIEEFEKIPQRARAERIRILATLGLKVSAGNAGGGGPLMHPAEGGGPVATDTGVKQTENPSAVTPETQPKTPSKRLSDFAKSLGA